MRPDGTCRCDDRSAELLGIEADERALWRDDETPTGRYVLPVTERQIAENEEQLNDAARHGRD